MTYSIKAMQNKVKALQRKLPANPGVVLSIEEWATIRRILSTTKLCEVCRARVDQALAKLSYVQPVQGGYLKQQAQHIQDTVFAALKECPYLRAPSWGQGACQYTVADALWKEGHL